MSSSINPTNNNIGGGGMGGIEQQQPYSNLADLEEARYAEEVKRSLGLCKEEVITGSKTSSNNNTQERTHTSDANSSITVSSNYEEKDSDEEMGAMVYKNSETAKARAAAETIEALSAMSDTGLKVNAAPLIHVGGRGGGGSSSVGKAKKKRRKINKGDGGDHTSVVAIAADAVCTMPLLDTLAEVANDLLSPSRRRKLPPVVHIGPPIPKKKTNDSNGTFYDCRFAQRIDDLREYKEKHGHLNVKQSDDKSLYTFCSRVRCTRKKPEKSKLDLTDARIASLDALGFVWTTEKDRGRKVYPAEEAREKDTKRPQGPNQGVLRPDIMRAPEELEAQEPPRQPHQRQQQPGVSPRALDKQEERE